MATAQKGDGRFATSSAPAGGRFDLFLNLGQVERACRLARRIVLHGYEELCCQLLNRNEDIHPFHDPIVVRVGVVLCLPERVAALVELSQGSRVPQKIHPRGVIRSKSDGKGGQTIEDTGPLTKKRMETIEEENLAAAKDFVTRQKNAGELRDHINYRKNDRWLSYRFYRALQRLKSPMRYICEIFGARRFSTFATWGNSGIEPDKGKGISSPGT